MRQIFRYWLAVGGEPKSFDLTGDPLAVEAHRLGAGPLAPHLVEFWAVHDDAVPAVSRVFAVVGTGHPLPDGSRWWGTTSRTPEDLVWHLVELATLSDGTL